MDKSFFIVSTQQENISMFTQFFNGCKIRGALVLFGVLSLTACGGGGGSSGNTQPTSVFDSSASVLSSNSSSASSLSSTIESVSSSSISSIELSSSSLESSSSISAIPFLMGGAIQKNSLNLAALVTTFAGKLSGFDGVDYTARFDAPGGVVRVGANLYVADTGNDTIRKIAIATGEVTTFAGKAKFFGAADGDRLAARFNMPSGITTDGANLYIVDNANHTIRKIVIETGVVTTLAGTVNAIGSADGTGANASFSYPKDITTDGTNLYVTDSYNDTIRKIVIATGEVTTIAGKAGVSGFADGVGTSATFHNPRGITTDAVNLYVADTTEGSIRKIVIATGVVTTLSLKEPGGGAALFHWPQGMSTDGINLYLADSDSHSIRKIVLATGAVTTLAGTSAMSGHADGIGSAAQFSRPEGVTTDGDNLYVTDTGNYTVRKIVIATGQVKTLAGTARGADGVGAAASFYDPWAAATDGTNLYVTDFYNHTVRKIVIATGEVTTLAGAPGIGGSADGIGSAASFRFPTGITTDGTNLFVADSYNSTIRKIVISTGVVTTLAGKATTQGSIDGVGAAARFNIPEGITTDGVDLYVTDTASVGSTVRKISIATGAVTTIAGTAGVGGSADGTGGAASFSYARGITTDGTNLYVADTDNYIIRKIVIASGVVTTFAGTANVWGSIDDIGAAARLDHPVGITSDGTNLYLTEYDTNVIRKIVIATGAVSTLAGSGVWYGGSADGIGTAASFGAPSGITTDGVDLFVTDTGNYTIRKIH